MQPATATGMSRTKRHKFKFVIDITWQPGNEVEESKAQLMLADLVRMLPEETRDQANTALAEEIEAARRNSGHDRTRPQ